MHNVARNLPHFAMDPAGPEAVQAFAQWMHGHGYPLAPDNPIAARVWRKPTRAERRVMCGAIGAPFGGGDPSPYRAFPGPGR